MSGSVNCSREYSSTIVPPVNTRNDDMWLKQKPRGRHKDRMAQDSTAKRKGELALTEGTPNAKIAGSTLSSEAGSNGFLGKCVQERDFK